MKTWPKSSTETQVLTEDRWQDEKRFQVTTGQDLEVEFGFGPWLRVIYNVGALIIGYTILGLLIVTIL